jgi:hypothetical protein
MESDFNPDTQYLSLKPEYSETITETTIRKSLYGGVMYDEIRYFDPSIVTSEEYENHYYLGFHFIFDFIDKPII